MKVEMRLLRVRNAPYSDPISGSRLLPPSQLLSLASIAAPVWHLRYPCPWMQIYHQRK